jgi:hypothetical protein
MVAPTTPRDALVKKRLREFFNVSPDFPFILNYFVLDPRRIRRQRHSAQKPIQLTPGLMFSFMYLKFAPGSDFHWKWTTLGLDTLD